MLNEQQVRQQWEMQLNRPMSDEEWETRRAIYLGADDETSMMFNTPREALDALDLTEIRMRSCDQRRAKESVSVTIEEPRRWGEYQARLFEHEYGVEVATVRQLLGIAERLLVPGEIPNFLRSQTPPPDAWGPDTTDRPYALTFWDPVAEQLDVVYVSRSEPGMFALHFVSEMMKSGNGIHQCDAVEYILCGGTPRAPWLRASSRWYLSTYEPRVSIFVGSMDVKPEEVAAIYARTRAQLKQESRPNWKYQFRRGTPDSQELLAFCGELRSTGVPWNEVALRWNLEHPDKPYKDGDTLSRVFRRHERQSKGGEIT